MKIESILGDQTLKDFKKNYIDKSKTLLLKNTLFQEEFDLKSIEIFVKQPENASHLRRLSNGTIVPFTEPDSFYTKIKDLEGKELWQQFCKNIFSLQITGLNKCFPEMKKINGQLYQQLNTGTQNYIVISQGLEKSSYKDHADPADLFAIQLQGSKIWNTPLSKDGKNLISYTTDLPYDPKRREQIDFDRFELCPGDIVFIPYMLPHFIEIEDPNETSIHIVISLTSNYFELIQNDFISQLKIHIDLFPAFKQFEQSHITTTEIVKKMKDEAITYLSNLSEEEFASKYITNLNQFEISRTLKG